MKTKINKKSHILLPLPRHLPRRRLNIHLNGPQNPLRRIRLLDIHTRCIRRCTRRRQRRRICLRFCRAIACSLKYLALGRASRFTVVITADVCICVALGSAAVGDIVAGVAGVAVVVGVVAF